MPKNMKVLFIDDEARTRKTFALMLGVLGYTVILAESGEVGLELYRREQPDLVLLDLRMPGMDGMRVLEKMRAYDADVNVIICTGHGDKDAVVDALRAGASDFISKPVDRVILKSALHRAEERIQLKRELRATQEALRQQNVQLEEQVKARTSELAQEVEAHRRVAAELRLSQARYQAIIEDQVELVERLTPGGQITFVNNACCRFYGKSRAELLGANFLAFVAPSDRALVAQRLATIGDDTPVITGENLVVNAQGQRRWMRWSNRGIFDAKGDLVEIQSVGIDITARKEMEEALAEQTRVLRQSEQRFNLFMEHLPAAVSIKDAEERLLFVNERFASILGHTPEDLVGLTSEDITPPELLSQYHLENQCVLKGETLKSESIYPGEHGPSHWLTYKFPIYQEDQPPLVGFVSLDITARKQAEAALRQSSERLRIQHEIDVAILAAQRPEEIAQVALEQLHTLISCKRASITEIDLAQARGRDLIVLVNGKSQNQPLDWHTLTKAGQQLIQVVQQGHPYVVHDIAALEVLSPLEEALMGAGLRSYVSLPLLGQNNFIGTLNLAGDRPGAFQTAHLEILEEVAASLTIALQQARLLEQTQQDAETKDLLLREVNHRVKNNLEAIMGLLYIERRHAPPETLSAYQHIIEDLNQRVTSLAHVHEMLSAGEWTPLNLSALAEQIIQSIVASVSNDVEVRLDIPPTSVVVTAAQAQRLALIFNELTTNTLKYAGVGRDVVHIDVQIVQEDEDIILTYHNDGPDYPADVLRLARFNAGLDIIQKIVYHNLQGTLTLRNNVGPVTEIQFKQQVKQR